MGNCVLRFVVEFVFQRLILFHGLICFIVLFCFHSPIILFYGKFVVVFHCFILVQFHGFVFLVLICFFLCFHSFSV